MSLVINEADKSIEELLKEKEYMKYLSAHISGVVRNFNLYFYPLVTQEYPDVTLESVSITELQAAISDKAFTIKDHDSSKYSDEEFFAYRKHYYPTQTEKSYGDEYLSRVEEEYNEAVKHHYANNEHHQEHWVDANNTLIDMSLSAIVEMICDWLSVGDYYKSSTLDWWHSDESDTERSYMTEKTRTITEDILNNIIFK